MSQYPDTEPMEKFSKSSSEFIPTDDSLPCPIEELTPLHPAIIENQATINIGTIGHVAHGKTTLVQSISGVLTIKHSHEKVRNITIKLGYANAKLYRCDNPLCPAPGCFKATGSKHHGELKCQRPGCGGIMRLIRHVSFVDCPGHEVLMSTMLSGAAVMDSAIMLIAADQPCPQAQTKEHLSAIQRMQVKDVIVVQNKIDLVKESETLVHSQQIAAFIQGTAASHFPVIPASAQLGLNVDYVIQYLATHIPVPVRDFISPPRLIVIRSFDVNRPGTPVDRITGGIAGGSLLSGVLKIGMPIELRPGIILQEPPPTTNSSYFLKFRPKTGDRQHNGYALVFLRSVISSLSSEENQLQFAVPGGLIGVGTNIDPARCKQDRLVGQVLGMPGHLPQIFSGVEIKYDLNSIILGTADDDDEEQEVTPLEEGEVLLANIGSHSDSATIAKLRGNLCKLELDKPVCAEKGERITLSRKIGKRWRLIGNGTILRGRKLKQD